ncbi:MAG TPA: helix-turn-helix domain-containing protein [Pseudonocardiaceae bacterium]|jgi:AcrR family transcriptional regulator
MDEQKSTRAPYRSALRARHAAATRGAILDAATGLFVDRGYAATSIDAIAEAAGVGRSTVFTATGGKSWLLKTAYDRALAGDDEPVPLAERPEGRRLEALTDATEIITSYVAIIAAAQGRVSALYEVVRVAADSDAEVRLLWQEIQQERLTGARRIAGYLAAAGDLADRLDTDRAADIVTVYNDPGVHHQLVRTRGWSQDDFQEWLARALHHELLT